MSDNDSNRQEIKTYLRQARYMLTVAYDNLQSDHYGTSVNRSYYAVFYAASALLLSIGEPRAKHYGVLSAFRQNFIKTGMWPTEFSRSYGRILTDRQSSDYQPSTIITQANAEDDLQDAQQFVAQAETWLQSEGWL